MDNRLETILSIPEESQYVEFKRLRGEEKVVSKIVQTIVAFANTDGGKIILGVDDPEKTKLKGLDRIYGIEENQENYDEIFHEAQNIIPAIKIDKEEIHIEDIDKTVVILTIPKATQSLHSVYDQAYARLKKSNIKLTPQEYINASYARGLKKADSELVDVDLGLLQTPYFETWTATRNISGSVKTVLLQTGLVRKQDGKVYPTRAAVMLFANFPTDLMETKCAIKIMKYTGTLEQYGETPNMIGIPKIINAPIIDQIRLAHEYVLTLISNGIEIHSGFITKYKIPERTIKEAITNAVIHRDYNAKRDIEIKIFEDRVEVISPGLFPYNINKNNIGFVRSEGYRNDLIVKHLREFPNPPNLDQNEGVIAMRNEMKANGLYPPIFVTYPDIPDSVKVVLLNEDSPSEWDKVKQYLENHHYITNAEAREITGVVQTVKMSKLFAKWAKQGLLLKVDSSGSNKDVKYELADSEEWLDK